MKAPPRPSSNAPPALPQVPAGPRPFSDLVRQRFARRADRYGTEARLQRSVALRLAHHGRDLALPVGPRADLGAGTGLLSAALVGVWPAARHPPPLQVDLCPELLARNPAAAASGGSALVWNLDAGLPACLEGAALLASSFALQWLDDPVTALSGWCGALAPGGLLVLALPTAGSFPQWRAAAAAAAVPCTALALPAAERLAAVPRRQGLQILRQETLRFSRSARDGLAALRPLRRLGADAARGTSLSHGQWRRLLHHWPGDGGLTWEVLLLLARRPGHPITSHAH